MPRARRPVQLAYLLLFVGAGVWLPYFPLYLSHVGLSGVEIGLVVGLQPLLRWTSAIGWAYFADRYRVRHRLLVGAAIAGSLCFAALLFARSFAQIAVASAAIALLNAPLIPMIDAVVVDHLANLGEDYGRLRSWGSIGFVVGALGSAAALRFASPAVVPLLLVTAQLGLAPAVARLPREQLGHPEHFRAPWRLLSAPLAAFLASSFLMQLSSGAWAGFFAALTQSLGLSDTVPGIAWGVAVGAEVVVMYFGRGILARLSAPGLLLLVLCVTAARYALTAVARSAAVLVSLQLAYGLGFAGFHLSAQMLLARLVPSRSTTNGQALYGLVSFGLGGSLGLALAGALVGTLGPAGLFAFEAVLVAAAIVPALWLHAMLRRIS